MEEDKKIKELTRLREMNKQRRGTIPWNKGKHWSEEIKQKLRESHKGQIPWNTGKHWSEENRKKMSESKKGQISPMKGKHHREESKKKMKELAKERMSHEENREKSRQGRLKQRFIIKDTKIEKIIQEHLTQRNIKFETHIAVLNICQPDIVFKKEKFAVFCDGVYWHKYPEGTERDHKQEKVLFENGWVFLRFWEHEIHEIPEICIDLIEEVLKNRELGEIIS